MVIGSCLEGEDGEVVVEEELTDCLFESVGTKEVDNDDDATNELSTRAAFVSATPGSMGWGTASIFVLVVRNLLRGLEAEIFGWNFSEVVLDTP